jgi:protein ImuB
MSHWLCLHFPQLALQVLARSVAEPRYLAVVSSEGNRRWIHDCGRWAAERGVNPHMGLATAYALAPELVVHPRNFSAEARTLERLASTAYGFSDRVSIASPDGLLLEIGASEKLFGGMSALLQCIAQELEILGYPAHLAVAPTPAAARLLAHAGRYLQVANLQPLPAAMADIPVTCCPWPEAVIRGFQGVGAHTISQALALPRDGVARRFGQSVGHYFDRLLGHQSDPLPQFKPPDRFTTRLELPAEVPDTEGLLFAVRRMLDELASFLRLRDAVIERFQLTLIHAPPATPTQLSLELLDPDRDPVRLTELVRERLRYLSLPAPVRELLLAAPKLIGHQPLASDLFERHTDHHDWARLRERLQSRLGPEAIVELLPHADHRPERAWQKRVEDAAAFPAPAICERPLWLLDPPRPLQQSTQRISGPERIESGWWDGQDASRDYYIAETDSGCRLWIYLDRRQQDGWYVHGIFA